MDAYKYIDLFLLVFTIKFSYFWYQYRYIYIYIYMLELGLQIKNYEKVVSKIVLFLKKKMKNKKRIQGKNLSKISFFF